MKKIRHVLGISGGKDSTALAIYLRDKYPELDIEYYFCDTGKELEETYQLIDNLEAYLGKPIIRLNAVPQSPDAPFDHFLTVYGGYLPSAGSRWCTRKLKLEPFEQWVGDKPVISYVAIRGDEQREAYISKKSNIQSIFPFRRNIWSEDVIDLVLHNNNIQGLANLFKKHVPKDKLEFVLEILNRPLSLKFNQSLKLNTLLDFSITIFNQVVFEFLKTTDYSLAKVDDFPLLENADNLVKEDIFRILEDSGVGLPRYYTKLEFEVDGQKGIYHRSRSGCFFCFFQQKIEWIWLYEQHHDLFEKAKEYEKDGFTWMNNERLEDLVKPERIREIKAENLKRIAQNSSNKSSKLLDILDYDEEPGCAACFI
ncbi:MAG: phosphoadenosine phosphosulfate reductase family protein [bacterium]